MGPLQQLPGPFASVPQSILAVFVRAQQLYEPHLNPQKDKKWEPQDGFFCQGVACLHCRPGHHVTARVRRRRRNIYPGLSADAAREHSWPSLGYPSHQVFAAESHAVAGLSVPRQELLPRPPGKSRSFGPFEPHRHSLHRLQNGALATEIGAASRSKGSSSSLRQGPSISKDGLILSPTKGSTAYGRVRFVPLKVDLSEGGIKRVERDDRKSSHGLSNEEASAETCGELVAMQSNVVGKLRSTTDGEEGPEPLKEEWKPRMQVRLPPAAERDSSDVVEDVRVMVDREKGAEDAKGSRGHFTEGGDVAAGSAGRHRQDRRKQIQESLAHLPSFLRRLV
jgi:hypothetical protein